MYENFTTQGRSYVMKFGFLGKESPVPYSYKGRAFSFKIGYHAKD